MHDSGHLLRVSGMSELCLHPKKPHRKNAEIYSLLCHIAQFHDLKLTGKERGTALILILLPKFFQQNPNLQSSKLLQQGIGFVKGETEGHPEKTLSKNVFLGYTDHG